MSATETPAVQVEGLSKSYASFTAVRDLTFVVRPGEIVGLAGVTGAGKTRPTRPSSGTPPPTSGPIYSCGYDVQNEPLDAKRALAYIPDTFHPYDLLTVIEHLHFIALAYRVENA